MSRPPRRLRIILATVGFWGGVASLGGCAGNSLPANGTMLPEDPDLGAKRRAAYAKAYDPKGRPAGQAKAKGKPPKPRSGWSLPQ